MEKYYKNFILSGEIDYYCVLCQESFDDEADVERHLRWEKHRKDLKLQEYLHKYKKDFIYKINDTYYCEVCNLITGDVAGHIRESSHQNQKTNPQRISKKSSLVKRDGSSIKVNDKTVTRRQWHGTKDGKCSLCGIDSISKVNTHILSAGHMSNLMHSSIKCEAGNCYRELKNDKFCCFTCFETIDNIHLTHHWTEKHSIKSETEKAPENTDKVEKSKDSNNNTSNIVVKILAEFHNKYYKIDVEKKTAKCLLCDASVTLTLQELDKHTSVFHPETEEMHLRITDSGKRRHELAEYASKNYIKLNEGGSKCFCKLCDVFMSAHMNCAKQHVEGSLHRGHLELKGLIKDVKHEKVPFKTVAYKNVLRNTYGPFHIAEYDVMVFNEEICIEVLSFGLIRVMDGFRGRRGKCYACDKMLNFIELLKHSKEKEHKNFVLKCKVLAMGEEHYEFIREIRPGLYHCGVCNKVFPFWENMAKHLRSFSHKVQSAKKNLLCGIASQLVLDPSRDLDEIDEYNKLRELDGID